MRKFEKYEPEYAAQYFLRKLVSEELAERINMRIYFRNMKDDYGRCWAYQDDPLDYSIVLHSDMGRIQSLRVLAHETVHVMQYATKKMQDVWHTKDRVLWKNRMVKNITAGAAHFELPWEKEAYKRQNSLLKSYLKHVKEFD